MLFIAPHPDDECLAGGGLIQQALKMGLDVRVVVLTAGDASEGAAQDFLGRYGCAALDYMTMGDARMQETRDALRTLGLPPGKVIFLCYADGSLNSLWDVDWD